MVLARSLKELTVAFGLEYLYNDSFAIRAGYFNENENKGARKYFTFGTGFKIDEINLDLILPAYLPLA